MIETRVNILYFCSFGLYCTVLSWFHKVQCMVLKSFLFIKTQHAEL